MEKYSTRRVQCLSLNTVMLGISGTFLAIAGSIHVRKQPYYSSLLGLHMNTIYVCFTLLGVQAVISSVAFLIVVSKKQDATPRGIYSIMVVVYSVLVAGTSIGAFVSEKNLIVDLNNHLVTTMSQYTTNLQIAQEWNVMQHELQCCGVQGPSNWDPYLNHTYPDSCCIEYRYNCGKSNKAKGILLKEQGCLKAVTQDVSQKASLMAYAGMTVSFLMILGVLLSYWYAKDI